MPAPDWTELTRFAIALAEASAREILPYFRRNTAVEVKDGPVWDPVTEGDRAGERIIRKMIEERYPGPRHPRRGIWLKEGTLALHLGAGPGGRHALLRLRHADLGHPDRPELRGQAGMWA